MQTGALLSAHLNDTFRAISNFLQPLPLADKKRQWLLDIDILPRSARQHPHQGMPVVRGGNNYCLYILAVQKLAEVLIGRGSAANSRNALISSFAMTVCNPHDLAGGDLGESCSVRLTDQTIADQAKRHPIVGAENTRVGRGSQYCDRGRMYERSAISSDVHSEFPDRVGAKLFRRGLVLRNRFLKLFRRFASCNFRQPSGDKDVPFRNLSRRNGDYLSVGVIGLHLF